MEKNKKKIIKIYIPYILNKKNVSITNIKGLYNWSK